MCDESQSSFVIFDASILLVVMKNILIIIKK